MEKVISGERASERTVPTLDLFHLLNFENQKKEKEGDLFLEAFGRWKEGEEIESNGSMRRVWKSRKLSVDSQ